MGTNMGEVVNGGNITEAAVERSPCLTDMQVSKEQLAYAKLLNRGSTIGIVLLVLGFILYITEILNPAVPAAVVPSVWHLSVQEYVEILGVSTGWAWITHLGQGDYFTFLGIAFLAVLTVIGYLVLLPSYIKRKDMAYTFIVAAEVCVLVLAASGILQAGGH